MKRAFALYALLLACAGGARAADMSSVPALPKPPLSGAPWTAEQITQLRAEIDALLRSPVLRGAHVGLLAEDAATHALLYARDVDGDYIPASNLKVLTGSVALARLGTDFAFHTVLYANGTVAPDAIEGDVVLRGGGDPLLRASDLDAAAAALAQRGVRTVRGNVVVDATYFDPPSYQPGWTWDDFPYSYAPLISAIDVEENAVHLTIAPGPSAGAPAVVTLAPQTSALPLRNEALTGARDAKDTVDIERLRDGTTRVFGTIPLGGSADTIDAAVPDPIAFAGDVLRRALTAHGVAVTGTVVAGTAPPNATPLWTHDSEKLPELLADFWYPSDNLVGESLLKALGVARGGVPGRADAGIALEQEYLRGIAVDPATITIADGSGLSIYNRFTPRAFVAILRADWNAPYRDVVLNALPVAGVRGSLASAYQATPAAAHVFAKTGLETLAHASTISGYIATRRHGTVIFSFQVGDFVGDLSALGDVRAKVFTRFIVD